MSTEGPQAHPQCREISLMDFSQARLIIQSYLCLLKSTSHCIQGNLLPGVSRCATFYWPTLPPNTKGENTRVCCNGKLNAKFAPM